MIIDHTQKAYLQKWQAIGSGRYNGAYYYSQEIVSNIIPNVQTDRNWITIRVPHIAVDHSIVFIHNNIHMEYYDYLKPFADLILVCGNEETAERIKARLGHKTIYLPLSVDTEYVKQFARPKTKKAAYAGRKEKTQYMTLPDGIDYLHGLKREDLLQAMAEYETIFSVGRTYIEAKILGCHAINTDKRYQGIDWPILDNKDAAIILQDKLNKL